MALDKAAAIQAVKTLCEGLDGMQQVVIGVPTDLPYQTSAFLTFAGDDAKPRATGCVGDDFGITVHLGYRVKDSTGAQREASELAIGALSEALIEAHWANKRLGGAVESSDLDFARTRSAQFEVRAGQEWRIWAVDLVCRQSFTFDPSEV